MEKHLSGDIAADSDAPAHEPGPGASPFTTNFRIDQNGSGTSTDSSTITWIASHARQSKIM